MNKLPVFPERFYDNPIKEQEVKGVIGEIVAEINSLNFVSAFINGKKTDEKIKMRLEFANTGFLNTNLNSFSAWLEKKGIQFERQKESGGGEKVIIKLIHQNEEKTIELELLVEKK